jgi:tRNA dimethylallyltransferase
MTRALLIMGPTASGKSALALALAERLGGEIVNADSMQVYKDLRVLTARPDPAEEARAPHHLYGTIDAATRFSVGLWLAAATEIIAGIRAREATPIVIGGTGLYFKALTEGLADAPAGAPEARQRLAAELAAAGGEALHQRLAGLDPESAARIRPTDPARLLRALEVVETGVKLSDLHAQKTPTLEDWAGIALRPERAALYAKIEARFDIMLKSGALDEVSGLAARGLDPMLPAMKAHGAPPLMAYLKGEISLEAASDLGKRDTRRYAKRQFTWMANQMPGWTKIEAEDEAERLEMALKALG